jgi:hypothetical protein
VVRATSGAAKDISVKLKPSEKLLGDFGYVPKGMGRLLDPE